MIQFFYLVIMPLFVLFSVWSYVDSNRKINSLQKALNGLILSHRSTKHTLTDSHELLKTNRDQLSRIYHKNYSNDSLHKKLDEFHSFLEDIKTDNEFQEFVNNIHGLREYKKAKENKAFGHP